tara:strand:- start:2540 stop:3379 length:840 start_codon:yes stop_codon:yes gene_type:complete
MSKFLKNAAVIEFDSEVKHEYQGMGRLRNTVTLRTNVTGESYKFARTGQGLANQKASQADVTPMDITYARQTATMENWLAPEYTDIFDQAEVNFDEKQELAKTIAKALARREDQIIIDSITAATFDLTPANADEGLLLATAAAGLTLTELRAASTGLTDRGIENSDRFVACSAAALNSLLGQTSITSSDFNTVKALVNGEIDSFMGFKFNVIETRVEGGLPTLVNYAYHKSAVGYAVGIDLKTTIDWVAHKTSWLCNGCMKSGAVVREAAGLVSMPTTS